jgi:hypothetical protein
MASREVPSLGGAVGNWIQDHVAIPDGDRRGERFLLTDDQWNFLLHFYALDERGEFVHRRGGMYVRPAKQGKSPLAAAIVLAEASGPTRFAGWKKGEPIGKPHPSPWIQIAAVSEDQTANTWRALLPMLQLGDLSYEIEDVGLTRVNLPLGGRIEFVTAAHRSRVGQRVTFAVLDELGFWLPGNRGHDLHDAIARNLAGMGGRFLGTTNAWATDEESVAQRLAGADAGIHVDDIEPPPFSIRNKAERRKALRHVYGASASGCEAQGNAEGPISPWIDLDRIEAEVSALIDRDEAQARRFFFNAKLAADVAAFDPRRWEELAAPRRVERGTLITIGVDGARFSDALAIIATEVETGYQWPLVIVERPDGASEDYEHDFDQVDVVVLEACEHFEVWRIYCDPQHIDPLVARWQGRWGERKVLPWYTNRPRAIAFAVRRFAEALAAGDLSHSGDPTFARHIRNAARRKVNVHDDDHRQLWTIAKDRRGSPRKMDAAMAAVLSWEARSDALAEGAGPREPLMAWV